MPVQGPALQDDLINIVSRTLPMMRSELMKISGDIQLSPSLAILLHKLETNEPMEMGPKEGGPPLPRSYHRPHTAGHSAGRDISA